MGRWRLQPWTGSSLVALHVSQQCRQQPSHRAFVRVSVMKTPLTVRQCPPDREQDIPYRPAPSFLLPCEQTRSPGSVNIVPEPTSPTLWRWFVQLVSETHNGREMCDCLWFHLGKRSSPYTVQCSMSPSTRAGSFQIDWVTYFHVIFLARGVRMENQTCKA